MPPAWRLPGPARAPTPARRQGARAGGAGGRAVRPVPRFPEHGLGAAPCASPRWHGPARRRAGPGQPAEGPAPPRYLQPGVGRPVGIAVRQTRGYCRERRGATRRRTGTATASTGVFTRAERRGAGCGRPRSKRVGYRQLRSLGQLRRRTGARGAGGRPADLAGGAAPGAPECVYPRIA